MKRNLLSVIFTLVLTCALAVPSYASFSTSDLAGRWEGGWMETLGGQNARYWLYIEEAIIDANGNFSSGTWRSSNGSSDAITGGTLSINSVGEITGTMQYAYSGQTLTTNIVKGQMDLGKGIVYFGMKKEGGQIAAGSLVKYQTDSGFAQSEIAGTWEAILLETDPGESYDTYWIDTSLTLANDGATLGTWNYNGLMSGNIIAPSSTTLSGAGALGGTLHIDNGVTVPISYGRLDLQLGFGSTVANKSDGNNCAMLFLRTGGSGFSTADIAGRWTIFQTRIVDGASLTWTAGEALFTDTGTMTEGSWTDQDGATGTYTAGSIAVSSAGKLSGSLTDNIEGKVHTIFNGHMSLTKKYAAAATRYKVDAAPETLTITVMFRKNVDNTGNLPAVYMLLN